MGTKKISDNPLIKFEDKWVALSSDRKQVVAAGGSIKEVTQKLSEDDKAKIILTKVMPFDKTSSLTSVDFSV